MLQRIGTNTVVSAGNFPFPQNAVKSEVAHGVRHMTCSQDQTERLGLSFFVIISLLIVTETIVA